LRLEYDYREQGSDTDEDFYARFYASGKRYWNNRLDLYVSLRLHHQFEDRSSDALSEDPFYSLDDTDSTTEQRVLQLYADLHDPSRRYALRGGRQYVEIADYLQLDGAQFLVNENGDLGGRAYFGHPVSFYGSVSGDYAGGLSLIGKPWQGNQSRVTVATYYDDSEDGSDYNYFLDVRQKWSDTTRTRGRVSVLNDEYRMAQADMFYTTDDGVTDLALGVNYWGAFDAETRAYSPLYQVLGEQDPYSYSYIRLTQQIMPHWYVSPGASLRVLTDPDDESSSNRDYRNYDVALIFQPNRSFNASVALEYWEVDDSDSFAGLSGDLRYRRGRAWEVSGGASYAQYTYDTYSDFNYVVGSGQAQFTENGTVVEESPYVKTYFVRGRYRILKNLSLRAQFDIEDNDESEDLAYRGRMAIEVRH